MLDGMTSGNRPVRVLETHGGEGRYQFLPTGEWTEGIGKLRQARREVVPAVEHYLQRVRDLGQGNERIFPGSPWLLASGLRKQDSAIFVEADADAHAALVRAVGQFPNVRVVHGDGYAELEALPGQAADTLVSIDPPFVARDEWTRAPDQLAAAYHREPTWRFALWYPIKSHVRPNAMLSRLRAAKVPYVAAELLVTPLDIKRNALAGSGMILVNSPPGLLAGLHAAATVLGPACATHEGRWFVRTTATG